jgi:hypothetical protein
VDRGRSRLPLPRLAVALVCGCVPSVSDDPPGSSLPLDVAPIVRARFAFASPGLDRASPLPAFSRSVQAFPDTARHDWAALLAAAATDDPVPACRLAVLLEDCRLARHVDVMIDTELSMAEREGRGPESVATEIIALEASGAEAQAACGMAPSELLAHEWSYLLRAALAGHEASMYRFVTDLPIDPHWPDETAAALAAWRRHAPAILSALVHRRSPDSLMLAYRAAQGFAIFGDEPLQPRNARAAARLGRALEIVHEDDPALAVELAALAHELESAQHRQAREEGERLAEAFMLAAPGRPSSGGDECDAGWPGMQAMWTAYGYQSGQ